MHLFKRLEQGAHTNVCPHGSTTGSLSCKQKASKQMTQWKGTTAAVAAAILDRSPMVRDIPGANPSSALSLLVRL